MASNGPEILEGSAIRRSCGKTHLGDYKFSLLKLIKLYLNFKIHLIPLVIIIQQLIIGSTNWRFARNQQTA